MASRPPPPPGFVPLQQPPQPQGGSRIITGTRLPPPQTDVNIQRDRVALDRERQSIEAERLRMERQRQEIEQGRRTASDPAGDAPATQRRDAGFYLRAARADGLYRQHQVDPRGVVGQTLADAFPRIGNATASPERQVAEAAQADFIGATLRYESGAAVPPAEFEMQRARYFPQPGDSPEVIAFKAELRRNAIEALQRSAGPAANGIDISTLSGEAPPIAQDVAGGAMGLVRGSMAGGAASPGAGGPGGPGGGMTVTDPNEGPRAQFMQGQQALDSGVIPGERYSTEQDRQLFEGFRARVQGGQSREEIQSWLDQAYPGARVNDAQWNQIEAARRNHQDMNIVPGESGVRDAVSAAGNLIAGRGQGTEAAAINFADSASLGLPGLFSEDYRRRIGDVREAHPVASTVGAIAGGLAAPGGVRAGMGLLEQSGRSAGQGAIYGFNSSGGSAENALIGGGIGGALPGAFNIAGRGFRGVRNALLPGANAADPEAISIANALNDENIPGSRPLLDPRVRDRMAYLESSVGSGGPVRAGLEATRRGVQSRVERLGAGGTAEDLGTMGERVQDAGRRYIDQSRTQAGRLYDRAANLAGDTRITPTNAVAVLDRSIAELGQVPGGAPKILTDLRNSLNGDFTVSGLRNLRTRLRDEFRTQNLTGSDTERRAMEVVDALSADINTGLTQAGRSEAAQAFRRADEFYQQRQSEIWQVVQRVIGPRDNPLSGEQVMSRIRTMASSKGDIARLNRMMSHFTPEERLDIAATIAEGAGQRSADEPFSPARFVTWAGTLSPRARSAIFGQEGAQSIENLSRISQALDATQKRLNNSRSGMVSNWRGWLRDFTTGGPLGAVVGVAGGGSAVSSGLAGAAIGGTAALGGMALRRLSAKALMSRDLSRWLAAAPRATTANGIRAHIDRLQVIARTNPSLSQEIVGLRSALMNAVNDNASTVTSAAASGPDAERNQ